MQIVRSVLGFLIGAIVSVAIIWAAETTNLIMHRPADAPGTEDLGKLMEWMKAFAEDQERLCAWIKTLPMEAFLVVLLAWEAGAFVGGWVSARIAGWAPLVHAGLIGGLVLLGTIAKFYQMKNTHNISHPDWMIVIGLAMPLPMSLLAGLIVSWQIGAPPSPPPASNP